MHAANCDVCARMICMALITVMVFYAGNQGLRVRVECIIFVIPPITVLSMGMCGCSNRVAVAAQIARL